MKHVRCRSIDDQEAKSLQHERRSEHKMESRELRSHGKGKDRKNVIVMGIYILVVLARVSSSRSTHYQSIMLLSTVRAF